MDSLHATILAALALSALCAAPSGLAQSFSSKPIRIVVGATAGGGIDIVARTVGQRLSDRLGQPVIVDNRPGAGTTIGGEVVAKAPADGHTMFMASTSFAISAGLYRKLTYDPLRELVGISLVASGPLVLVVHPSVPARSITELIRLAKERPGRLTFASGGIGSSLHLAGELFRLRAGLNLVHVPYKGGAPAAADLMSGQVDLLFQVIVGLLPNVNSGRMRALAVTSAKRSSLMPEVPTMIEAGVPEFDVAGWFGLLTPTHTPKSTIAALNEAVVWGLSDPSVRARLAALGADPVGGSAEAFQAYFHAEVHRWRSLVESLGLLMN